MPHIGLPLQSSTWIVTLFAVGRAHFLSRSVDYVMKWRWTWRGTFRLNRRGGEGEHCLPETNFHVLLKWEYRAFTRLHQICRSCCFLLLRLVSAVSRRLSCQAVSTTMNDSDRLRPPPRCGTIRNKVRANERELLRPDQTCVKKWYPQFSEECYPSPTFE